MMRETFSTDPTISVDLFDAGADQALDLARRAGAALRQAADFSGHDRKAAALLAGARRFDGGIECQDIGLEGDAIDDADDVGYLLRAGVDFTHGLDHLGHDLAAAYGNLGGRACQCRGLDSGRGRCAHRAREFIHRRGGGLQIARRLFRSLGKIQGPGGNLGARRLDAVGRALHLEHCRIHPHDGAL
jgi:hypothetical protein